MSKVQMERWSEEEHLEYDKYSSNMYSNNQGDLLGSSSDKDVHHERIRMKKNPKIFSRNLLLLHQIHCSYFSDRIYVEKTTEQCCLGYHNSQKTKEGV